MRDHNTENIYEATKDTLQMVRQAIETEEIYPENPNLVLSTDDTTLFVFEGKVSGTDKEDWDWKMIDMTTNSSSVRSNFEVDEDAENSGGLQVRSNLTFTESGMSAPLYV